MSRLESMQTVGKRRADWKTIDDYEHDERRGRKRSRQGSKIAGAGVAIGSLSVKASIGQKPGIAAEVRNIGTAYRFSRDLRGTLPAAQRAKFLGRIHAGNPYGTALAAGGATIATGLAVQGIGARQAKAARRNMQERRKMNAEQARRRQQTLQRFGKAASVGRRMDDVEKRERHYDPDVRRRHNQGAVTGAAAVGAAGMGAKTARELRTDMTVSRGSRGVVVTGRAARLGAGAAGLGALTVGSYKRGTGGRNRRYS